MAAVSMLTTGDAWHMQQALNGGCGSWPGGASSGSSAAGLIQRAVNGSLLGSHQGPLATQSSLRSCITKHNTQLL